MSTTNNYIRLPKIISQLKQQHSNPLLHDTQSINTNIVMQGKTITVDVSRAKSNKHVVSLCAKSLGLTEVSTPTTQPSDIYWHNVVYPDLRTSIKSASSAVNKFPGMTELTKKISLTKSLRSMQQLFPSEYTFYPHSWIIPIQLNDFKEYCNQGKKDGNGIYLLDKFEDLKSLTDRQLIQEYIGDPFLMSDQLKFDFRIYAVVKSLNPLSIYVAREGMVRFCTEKYKKPVSNKELNLFAHLTNYSLNKSSNAYKHSTSLKDQIKGSKRLLSTVFHQMDKRGMNTRKLWHKIKIIIVKTVIAMLPEIMLNYEQAFHDIPGPNCFQIMGFDVMVQGDGTPILLEVNSAPSLTIEHSISDDAVPVRSIVDEVIKVPLVRDCLLLAMNQLENEYHSRTDIGTANSIESSKTSTSNTLSGVFKNKSASHSDDIILELKARERKPHLSEIFPIRYGESSGHLLFLDKAVYLYMHFINIKAGTRITHSGIKAFMRKCNLTNLLTPQQLSDKLNEVQEYYMGSEAPSTNNTSLPFHAFLQLLFYLANVKFSFAHNLLGSMQRLLEFCDNSLRSYGIQGARLRRTEVEKDENGNGMEIYLLPSRIKRGRTFLKSRNGMIRSQSESLRKKWDNKTNVVLFKDRTNGFKLPKISITNK